MGAKYRRPRHRPPPPNLSDGVSDRFFSGPRQLIRVLEYWGGGGEANIPGCPSFTSGPAAKRKAIVPIR